MLSYLKKGFGNYDVYHSDRFTEEKGITPKQMIELKAMMGDSSDNYPGVRGIGEKNSNKITQGTWVIGYHFKEFGQVNKGSTYQV